MPFMSDCLRLEELEPVELQAGTITELAATFLGLPAAVNSIRTVKSIVYFYTGNRWQQTDPWELEDAIRLFMGMCSYNCGKGKMAPVDPHSSKVGSVASMVMSLTRVDTEETPLWLGKEACPWNPKYTVSLQDCVIDLKASQVQKTWAKHPKTKDWFDTMVLPFTFEQMVGAPIPMFTETLEQWSGGDEAWKELLLRMTGYVLMPYRGYQRAFLQVGKKRGGKGTWTRVMEGLLGEGNTFSTDLERIVYSHGLVGSEGKRLILLSEVGRSGTFLGGTLRRYLNVIIGGDKSQINHKGGLLYGAKLPGAIVMVGNDLPEVEDETDSFWGKVCILPYNNSFLGRENFDLDDELKAELPGIGRCVLEAAIRLIEAPAAKKWPVPQGAAEKRSRLTRMNSPVTAFIQDKCILDGRMWATKEDVYNLYGQWCKMYDEPALARNAFFRKVWDSGLPLKEAKRGPKGNQIGVVMGLALRPEKDQQE